MKVLTPEEVVNILEKYKQGYIKAPQDPVAKDIYTLCFSHENQRSPTALEVLSKAHRAKEILGAHAANFGELEMTFFSQFSVLVDRLGLL